MFIFPMKQCDCGLLENLRLNPHLDPRALQWKVDIHVWSDHVHRALGANSSLPDELDDEDT
jgi:hypothetical protein